MSAVGQASPFSDASEYNMLDFIIARALDDMQTVSIGEVKAVNTGAQTVDVQILVNLVTGANTPVEHQVIAGRPYFRLQGGGNAIICDPDVGDIGVVVFASRDLTGVIAAKGAANPSSNRRFSWSDGVYFGGSLNEAPTQYMQFLAAGGGINIVSPATFAIQAPATTISGTANVAGDTTLQATLAVTGTSTLTGAVSAPGGITTTTIAGVSAVFTGSVTASSFIGGGGGGGSVTSVGISTPGVGVVVGGGPITVAGTLTVDLSSTAYAALALAVTALQSISIATGTGLTGGPLHASGSTVSLANTSVTPGNYTNADITVDAQGRITAASNGGGGGTQIPVTIPGLVYWFDASTSAITGSGGQVPVIGSPDPVRLPFAAYGVAKGASNVGNTLNGLPVLTVGATGVPTGAYSMPTAAAFNLGSGSTVFVVMKPTTSFAGQPVMLSGAAGSLAFFIGTGGNIKLNNAGISSIATSTRALSLGTAVQCNYTYTNTTGAWAFRIARAADSSGTASNTATAVVTTLFDYGGGGEPFIGDFAELIAYNRVLTGPEIAAVEAYILAKWGV